MVWAFCMGLGPDKGPGLNLSGDEKLLGLTWNDMGV